MAAIKLCLLLSLIFLATLSHACPAMPASKITVEQVMKKADLIVVGRRIDSSVSTIEQAMPEFIYIEVNRVLKGKNNKKVIAVKSWSGMCLYGVALNLGDTAILSLRYFQTTDPKNAAKMISYYVPAEMNNGYTKLPVIKSTNGGVGNSVKIDDSEISLDDFVKKYRIK
jgi:hypothetical protein